MTRVAVVGTCASGKTSVVRELRARGIDAYAVAQEHSAISRLWAHQEPDFVVYLEASLETIRRRREDDAWPEWIYRLQRERLEDARRNAGIVVAVDEATVEEVADAILDAINGQPSSRP